MLIIIIIIIKTYIAPYINSINNTKSQSAEHKILNTLNMKYILKTVKL